MKSLTLPAVPGNVPRLLDLVDEVSRLAGMAPQEGLDLRLCAEEMLVNVTAYAYPPERFPGGPGDMRLDAEPTVEGVRLRIVDQGQPFNPLERAEPDVALPVGQRSIGGLGIFIVRRKTDRQAYERTDGSNILTLEKRRAPKEVPA